ncbi:MULTISPECIES: variant leucine-rich repeat-containing protein [Nostocales]|uniref:Leucine rich repeat variant domain-containing protein n=3 Tax=Nostocales TaxID=1161 RepID=A0A0C1NER2_9CYAN|nr:hypothetical protein [Tolypothrix bouteillei]KAF3887348.1 hypothetical protein DA73_0400019015 [Tolypothrix bouteillei VB521301]
MQLTPEEEASDQNTPAERLRELAAKGNTTIRSAVAQNPNTPPDLLLQLFYFLPVEVLNNPAIPLLLLENPNFLTELYQSNNLVFLNHELPLFFLEWAIHQPDESIKIALAKSFFVAANTQTSESTLQKLARDIMDNVRLITAQNKNTPTDALETLAKDRNEKVRFAVANNSSTPIATLKNLANDNNPSVSAAAKNSLIKEYL